MVKQRLALTLLVVIAVGACGESETSSPAASKQDAPAKVVIKTFQFQPNDLQIDTGTRVVWTNNDQILHTVTAGMREYDPADSGRVVAEEKSGTFDQQLDGASTTFTFTFREAGTYHYFCSRHPGMEANVTVV